MEFSKDLDSAEYNILPVKEWFPATSRFIRSSISRIRQRSPSPHLGLDISELKTNGFEDERRFAIQRIRLADLEPNRTELISFKIESEELNLRTFFKETGEFEQRKDLLEKSLSSVSYLMNTLRGCQSLLKEINSVFESVDDVESLKFRMKDFVGDEFISKGEGIVRRINQHLDSIDDFIKSPLELQVEDVYSLTRGLNERIFALKALDMALIDRSRACSQLDQIQSEAVEAMGRAQGSLHRLTSSSLAFDRKIAAKNAEIEKRIRRVEECTKDFGIVDVNISMQLGKWESISDTFLLDKLKEIS